MRLSIILILISTLFWSCEWTPEAVEVDTETKLMPINLALGDTTTVTQLTQGFEVVSVSVTDIIELEVLTDSTMQIVGQALGKTQVTLSYIINAAEDSDEPSYGTIYLLVTVTDGIPLQIILGEWTTLDVSEKLPLDLASRVDSLAINKDNWISDEGITAHVNPQVNTEIHLMGLSPGIHSLEIVVFDSGGIQLAPLYFEVTSKIRKISLAELFTNAGCVNCPVANHNLDLLYDDYPNDFTAIRYHVFWTDPNDPMNLYNPTEVEARRLYYGASWEAPRLIMNGVAEPAYENMETLSGIVNQYSASESDIHIWHPGYDASNDSLFITYRIQNFDLPKQNIVAWTVLTQDSIEYIGTNGEVIHMQVMRDMTYKVISELNDNTLVTASLKKTPEYSIGNQFHVVVFIQDQITQEILQTIDYSTNELAFPTLDEHGF